jgi:hypothetical protein
MYYPIDDNYGKERLKQYVKEAAEYALVKRIQAGQPQYQNRVLIALSEAMINLGQKLQGQPLPNSGKPVTR